jgi:death-on-curing protein
MPPVFLNLAEVLEIHRDQIERYGGQPGIRDLDLLQSALAMPAAGFGDRYLHEDLLEMAAAYLFHIARNHPFVDGNKRTVAAASTRRFPSSIYPSLSQGRKARSGSMPTGAG